jgi:hypothetical protein
MSDASNSQASLDQESVEGIGAVGLEKDVIDLVDEDESTVHYTTSKRKVTKGKSAGQFVNYFNCSYCSKIFQGPSTSSCLKHLRNVHPKKCPDILLKDGEGKPKRSIKDFFGMSKLSKPFDEDVFMGKLLKWIVKTDEPFSVVDNEYFIDLMNYLKKDVLTISRQTLMRRLDEVYELKKEQLKKVLSSFDSKYSV